MFHKEIIAQILHYIFNLYQGKYKKKRKADLNENNNNNSGPLVFWIKKEHLLHK
jgi:hypothetical protein